MARGPVRFLILSSVGFVLAAATLLCTGLGYLLDKKLGTFPVFTMIGMTFGLVAGVIEVIRMINQAGD